jgi:hypothetical protein
MGKRKILCPAWSPTTILQSTVPWPGIVLNALSRRLIVTVVVVNNNNNNDGLYFMQQVS